MSTKNHNLWVSAFVQAMRALLLLLCLNSAAAHAEALPVQRHVFLDSGAALGVDQVAALDETSWQRAGEVVAKGYISGALWMRLQVPPRSGPVTPLRLRLMPVFLDDVRIYTASNHQAGTPPSGWTLHQMGDHYPFESRARKEIAYTVDLGPTSNEHTQTIYVRVHTQSQLGLSAVVLTPEGSEQLEDRTKILFGLFLGLTLVLVWRAWLGWHASRDALWLWAGAFQLGSIWVGTVFIGVAAKYLWPQHSVDMLGSWGGCFHMLVGSIMYALVYRAYGLPLWANLINFRHLLLFPVQAWLLWQGQVREAMSLNGLSLFWGTIVSTVLAFSLLRIADRRQSWILRINIAISFSALVWLTGAQLGILPPTQFQFLPLLHINIFTGLLLDALLSRRWQVAHEEAVGAHAQLGHTRELLKLERHRLQEKESFMSMLMHEIKNPLAAIRAAAMNRRYESIDTSVGAIDAVLERVRQIDRVESGKQQVHWQLCDVPNLLQACADLSTAPERVLFNPDPSLLNLSARLDPLLMQHMVANLLDNAIKYGDPAHPIVLSLHSTDMEVTPPDSGAETSTARAPAFVVRVSNAVGIAGCPDPNQVFSKYYRGEYSQSRSGTGLGLYLVSLLAGLCHARVSCHTDMQAQPARIWFDLVHPL
jgi:two-component system, sensor histidine kinase LadS